MRIQFKKIAIPGAPAVLAKAAAVPEREQTPEIVAELTPEVEVKTAAVPDHALYPSLTSKFLLAGKAVFTVTNRKGEHYTFKVRKVESEWKGQPQTTFFVSVKAPGGAFPYRYIGLLNKETGGIKCTAKSEFIPGTREYDVAAWACSAVIEMKFIPEGYKIEHAGLCGRCGRTLTDPVSIERGIGPECWEHSS